MIVVSTEDDLEVLYVDVAVATVCGLEIEERVIREHTEHGAVAERDHLLIDHIDVTVGIQIPRQAVQRHVGVVDPLDDELGAVAIEKQHAGGDIVD